MDDKKKKTVYAAGKLYPEKPSMMDYIKEAFEPTENKAQLEAVRRRRQRMGS